MIPKTAVNYKPRLSRVSLTALRNLARHGSDAELERFMLDVNEAYLKASTGKEFIDPTKYLKVKGVRFECECPYCQEQMLLLLDELLDKGENT